MGFPHEFSISAQKVTPQGLVDAPDPQESILGPEQWRLVRFSISLAQNIAYGCDQLLDYADLIKKFKRLCIPYQPTAIFKSLNTPTQYPKDSIYGGLLPTFGPLCCANIP